MDPEYTITEKLNRIQDISLECVVLFAKVCSFRSRVPMVDLPVDLGVITSIYQRYKHLESFVQLLGYFA